MSNNIDLQILKNHREALLLAAIGALLHNLGKIHAKFLDKQINGKNNHYLYQHILNLIAPYVSQLPVEWQNRYSNLSTSTILDSDTVDALKAGFNLPAPLNDRTNYTIGDLIEYLGQGEPWYELENGKFGIEYIFPSGSRLTHLMNRAHRGASGGEKEKIATAQQPDATDLYLSTPFGYEIAAPNINTINNLLQKIEKAIQKHLKLPANPLLLANLIADIRPLLGQAIADTQRPLNDVTIGDIGHTGMAFLLTQAVEWILTGRTITHTELAQKEAKNTLFWRVLTVHTDSLRYLAEAVSLADLRVRQQQLQKTFRKVSQKLEETLLAVEIYADEQRRLFVIPNLDSHTPAYQAIENIVAEFDIDGLRLTSQLSAPVTNHPRDKGDYIGDVVLQQLQEMPPYDFNADFVDKFWVEYTNDRRTPICTACNLRPQGYGAELVETYKHNPKYYREKAEERKICCVCMERRTGVAKKWAENGLSTTVWTNEVADSNGRLALVVGHWNLQYFNQTLAYPHDSNAKSKPMWMHTVRFVGNSCPDQHTFTLNKQAYSWHSKSSTLSGEQKLAPFKQTNLSIYAPSQMSITIQDVTVAGKQLSLTVKENLSKTFAVGSQVKCLGQDFRITGAHTLETIDDVGRQKILNNILWDTTYPFIVQNAIKVNVLKITSPGMGAKNLSFARLRRVWETTQRFWESALKDEHGASVIPDIPHRLLLKGMIKNDDGNSVLLNTGQAYDLLVHGFKLSVVWDGERFLVCDNPAYFEKTTKKKLADVLVKGASFTLTTSEGYKKQDRKIGTFTITTQPEKRSTPYAPVIPILAEPQVFLALVPAEKALDVVQAIKNKYETEMGKVRNRLPLHLGLVFAGRRIPLQAILDAGRAMLRAKVSEQGQIWSVASKEPPEPPKDVNWPEKVLLRLERNGSRIELEIPTVMGDDDTPDFWYPYWRVEGKFTDRKRRFIDPDGKHWVHVTELKETDQVHFAPSTFDFEFLDSTARRFAIYYDKRGRRPRRTRPYYLEDLERLKSVWETFSKLSRTQLKQILQTIEITRERWRIPLGEQATGDKVFMQFVADTLANANWPGKDFWKGEERQTLLTQLTQAAARGELADLAELHLEILKEKA